LGPQAIGQHGQHRQDKAGERLSPGHEGGKREGGGHADELHRELREHIEGEPDVTKAPRENAHDAHDQADQGTTPFDVTLLLLWLLDRLGLDQNEIGGPVRISRRSGRQTWYSMAYT
jgi:hypothetical protein